MPYLEQTDPIPGQAVTVTIPFLDRNGNLQSGKIKVAPGKDAVLPDNLLTEDEIKNYVLGNLGTGQSDRQAVGIHWNGWQDTPELVYGTLQNQLFSNLLGTNAAGLYLTNSGNIVPEITGSSRTLIQTFLATTPTNTPRGTITFPRAFAPGTQPFVFCSPVTEVGTETTSITDVKQNSDGSLQITNTGFNYYRTTGTEGSAASLTVPVLAIGVLR